ncbi:nitrate- and nitrite sensing domain-containing protein [Streptomyces sp. A3M-1-3]|uniref:sensor histidine kinase n=1 Tax=Streptomyces sp. A3M-1-3 TaxID=2962044 RepID=UPI0020B6C901|nr:nitrate- and nitrite sensing domain-containing protein [Streptomyces sp. A3M-1-3]MCP3818784.1 nitrate- and nitrite sensing domain-containing protein [Streptomyces sp. A3M-1-3]
MRTPRRTLGAEAAPLPAPPARGRRAHAGPPADEHAAQEQLTARTNGPTGAPSPVPSRGWRLRPRTVRAKIVSLLMVPVVSLLALWAFATVSTAQDVARLQQLQRVDDEVRSPVASAVAELQAERRAAVRYLAVPDAARAAALDQQAGQTDRAVAKLRLGDRHTVADAGDLPAGVADRLEEFVAGAERLQGVRKNVTDRRAGWDATYAAYTKAIGSAFAVGGALSGIQDAELGSDARVLLEFGRAGEMLAREDALLSAAQLSRSLSGDRLRQFTGAVETRRALTESAVADLPDAQRAAWRALSTGSAYGKLRAAEDKVLAAPPGRKAADAVPATAWDESYTAVGTALRAIETAAHRTAADRSDPLTRGVLSPAGAAVLLGLGAVAASLVISVRIGRGLVVELVTLRNSALEIAHRKLPHAMRRLRAGEEIDVRAETPPGAPAEDEITQVGEALTTVHRAALSAAVERAELASGISGVFVNLARRSQVLVHRQLNLLDAMERRADDPGELGDLFRLDHLTTRMRRHAESLIILSGAAPGRAWRMPVPLTNVVRAAVSEIEDYARVEVRQLPEAAVAGAAVADLTHLLAELVENAAQFSPPHTRVRVSGEPVGNGYALEIEDRGLGMGKETLADANRRIEQSEALDLFDSDRLGLFVVSRLSARHDIKVHLRTSPYGGTTAVVLLPTALMQSALPTGSRAGSAEEPRQQAEEREDRPERHGSAAIPGPRPARNGSTAVPAPASRPALAGVAGTQATHSSPGPSADSAGSAATAPAPTPDPTPPGVTALRLRGAPAPDAPGAVTELPRRVRQASLVPQLREAPAPDAEAAGQDPDGEDAGRRTPEQARDRMAAYRNGWARGSARGSEGEQT